MKRVLGSLAGLVLLAVVIVLGAVPFGSGADQADDATITKYLADFVVHKNGELDVTETLTVSFPGFDHHGIFRFFDTRVPNLSKNRQIPKDIRVTRDGVDEPFKVLSERRGRYRNIKIGSADTPLSGAHVYRISYAIDGALTKGFDGARTRFYWSLIPSGWKMPISAAELTVKLPADGENFKCAIGTDKSDGCRAEGDGTKSLMVAVDHPLAPNTPVTISADLDIPTPPGDTLPWSSRLDPILGRHPAMIGLVLLLSALVSVGGLALSRSSSEKKPSFPLMYAPPDGIGPAQAAYLLTEKVETKAFVATLMYAAENGAVELAQEDKKWTVTGTKDGHDAWAKVDDVTQLLGAKLDVLQQGARFTASPKSASSGEKLKSALSSFDSNTKAWAKTSGLMVGSGLGGGGLFVLLLVAALTAYLGIFNPFNMSLVALIPGLFGIAALNVGFSGAGTKRTPAGRELWGRIGGFKRILSTSSAEDRFDFSGRKELYTAYLPWAVAFDCADEWAKKYRIEVGQEPPTPSYFPVYAGVHTGNYVGQMVDSFDSSVSSAISSYEATQSSSSSGGGGGFSGGGGGGGGGGGSW